MSSVGIRYAIHFEPQRTTRIRLLGLNHRIYSRIISSISAIDYEYGTQLHEFEDKPFTFSRLMPVDKEVRRDKRRWLKKIEGQPALEFDTPFVMYFSSMVSDIADKFIRGINEINPPFNADIVRITPLIIEPKPRASLATLSPIYVRGGESPDKIEFRDAITDKLKKRVMVYRGINISSVPTYSLIIDYHRGFKPKKEVVRFMSEAPPVDARSMKFTYSGPKTLLMAGLLGGFGYKTHMGFGYVNLWKSKRRE